MTGKANKAESDDSKEVPNRENLPKHCGIIMPIADMPGYEPAHWGRVLVMLTEAIQSAGYTGRLVSDSDEVQVIHTNIVQNIHDDEIVVCDVSGKNANVMFELGLRLAFDKPVIIVKDNATDYSFDTSPIKHIGYRKDLRFDDVIAFKGKVAAAIKSTVKAKQDDPAYSPFLRNFRHITAKTLGSEEISQSEFLLRRIEDIGSLVENLSVNIQRSNSTTNYDWAKIRDENAVRNSVVVYSKEQISAIYAEIKQMIADQFNGDGNHRKNKLYLHGAKVNMLAMVSAKFALQYPHLGSHAVESLFENAWTNQFSES